MLRARPCERRVATIWSEKLPKISLTAALRISFWPIRDFQNPITTDLMDKTPDHGQGAHFATKRPLVVKNRGSKLFETFPFLKCRASLYKVESSRVLNKVDLLSDLAGLAA